MDSITLLYTDREGGEWQPWGDEPLPTPLDLRKRHELYKDGKVQIGTRFVHALRYPNGEEWDCFNGWRKKA